jgi:hypothetical protein
MARNPSFGNNCTDNGMANGRPNSAIAGCPTTGQISRWRLVDGAVIGNEQPLIGGFNLVCAQFRVHGIDYLLAQDNVLYFSVGAGDNANIQPDYGQFGGDPCGGGGAFRAQDANGLNGKILRYDIASNTTTVLAKGLKNPWRFTIASNGIYTGEWAASPGARARHLCHGLAPAAGSRFLLPPRLARPSPTAIQLPCVSAALQPSPVRASMTRSTGRCPSARPPPSTTAPLAGRASTTRPLRCVAPHGAAAVMLQLIEPSLPRSVEITAPLHAFASPLAPPPCPTAVHGKQRKPVQRRGACSVRHQPCLRVQPP